MTKQEFIDSIAAAAKKYASSYGIKVISPIIAQAILESAWGASSKAKYHNYFGLKYRANRVTCNNGYFEDGGSEQSADGTYTNLPSATAWYAFDSLDLGVKGYFEFINIANYANLKGVTDAKVYLKNIKADGYATSLKYVDNVYAVIIANNLFQYDESNEEKEESELSNSSLVSFTKISPNKSSPRNHAIDTITIHCVVGQCNVETLGNVFASATRQASSNYGVGPDGRVGMYVEEKDRSWCSSSSSNDNRAITIEVASDTTSPYAVTDAALAGLIKLCADICKRNGISKLVWSTDKNQRINHLNGCNMTVHRDYANKSCPGEYLYGKHAYIAAEVNKLLGVGTSTETNDSTNGALYRVQCGAFFQKSNADAMLAKVKTAGFDTYLVQVGCLYKVQTGAYSIKANAEAQLNKLKAKGFDAFITTKTGIAATVTKKSVAEIAKEVIAGKWGNGDARKQKLQAAGYNYSEVQSKINELFS